MFIPDQVCPSLQTGTSVPVLIGIRDTATMGWTRQTQPGKTQALQLASLYSNTMGSVFGLGRIVPWYSWGICTSRLIGVLLFLPLPHRTVKHPSAALPDPDPHRNSERLTKWLK